MFVLARFSQFLLTWHIVQSTGVYKALSSKPNVTFKYTDGIEGESGLHECGPREACNVIHNRFWMTNLVERLCRCPNGKECPWTENPDNSSMSINNRSVFKFCTSIWNLDICTAEQDAVLVQGKGDTNNSYLIPRNTLVNCTCANTHYWKLQKFVYEEDSVMQIFRCAPKTLCEAHDFCGHIRADLFSTYYRCSCPEGHLCVFKDRTQQNVQELLYSGPAYSAYCQPFKS